MAAIASTSRAIYRYPHTYVPFGGEFVLFRSILVRRSIVSSSALRLFLGMLRFLRRKNFEFEIFRLFDSGRSRSFLDRSKRRGIGSVKCFTTRANTSRLLSWPRPSRISIPKRRKEGRKESRALCLRGMMHRSTNSG